MPDVPTARIPRGHRNGRAHDKGLPPFEWALGGHGLAESRRVTAAERSAVMRTRTARQVASASLPGAAAAPDEASDAMLFASV
eukprot:366363-Chlamydomonas_euryale.AAC.14